MSWIKQRSAAPGLLHRDAIRTARANLLHLRRNDRPCVLIPLALWKRIAVGTTRNARLQAVFGYGTLVRRDSIDCRRFEGRSCRLSNAMPCLRADSRYSAPKRVSRSAATTYISAQT